MSSCIFISMMFNQLVLLMMVKQVKFSYLEQQIVIGSKIVSVKDDLVVVGIVVGFDCSLVVLDCMKFNVGNVQNCLGVQENILVQVNDLMVCVNDLIIQVSNLVLSVVDKKMLIIEVNQICDGLLLLVNVDDGIGCYVFGGINDGDLLFVKINGKVVYCGDQIQCQVEVGFDIYVCDVLFGSEIFMCIFIGDGFVDGSVVVGNIGNGVLINIICDGSDSWNGQGFSVCFIIGIQYEVVDGVGNVIGIGIYKVGDDLEVNGVCLCIIGVLVVGDSFSVQVVSSCDIFFIMDNLVVVLGVDIGIIVQMIVQQNQLQSVLCDVVCVLEWMIDLCVVGGVQLKVLDNVVEMCEVNGVILKIMLLQMCDLDYVDVLSQYQLQSIVLQVVQMIFLQMQLMLLFNKLC